MQRGSSSWRPHNVVLGIGNWFYPRSRENVAMALFNKFAQREKLVWRFVPRLCSDIITLNNVSFVKPKSYKRELLPNTLRETMNWFEQPLSNITLLRADATQPLGYCTKNDQEWEESEKDNMYLAPIIESLKTSEEKEVTYPQRVGVGIQTDAINLCTTPLQHFTEHVDDKTQADLFLKNVFTLEEEELLQEMVNPLFERLQNELGGETVTVFNRLNSL